MYNTKKKICFCDGRVDFLSHADDDREKAQTLSNEHCQRGMFEPIYKISIDDILNVSSGRTSRLIKES